MSTSPRTWPVKIDLAVGEQGTFTLQDGSQRVLKLAGYRVVIPRHKVEATVEVSGNGRMETHTLHVALDGVPVSINGIRVYAYAWKEANDYGFEPVGEQAGFPLTKGKDVGFAVSDARFTMFPNMERSTYPFEVAFHEGAFLQTWLEPDEWAHSGYDVGLHAGSRVLAPIDGYAYFTWYSNQGYVTVKAKPGKYSSPGWVFTHIKRGGAFVAEGQQVPKGTPLAEVFPDPAPSHVHMGATPNDFGAWIWAAEVWNYEMRDRFPTPRQWLGLGPFPGNMDTGKIAIDERTDLPESLQPRAGGADLDGTARWRTVDNFVNSVVRMGEVLSEAPFSGYQDREGRDSIGYLATYIYSPRDHAADGSIHLKLGVSYGGRVWLNGKMVFDSIEERYQTYDLGTEPAIVKDKYDVVLPLRQGWNTLILKTNHGSRRGTAWLASAKIGDVNGRRVPELYFSTRDTNLQAANAGGRLELRWRHPDFHGTFVDGYKLDVATDAGFTDLVVSDRDLGRVTEYSVEGIGVGTSLYVRLRPFNTSEYGGLTYWQHVDIAKVGATAS